MSLSENLPVFKTSYELLCVVYGLCVDMERAYRFTLGERLQKETTDLLLNIYRANSVVDKRCYIMAARENILVVRILFRVAYEKKQMAIKKWIVVNDHIESISKQLTAWGQYVERKT